MQVLKEIFLSAYSLILIDSILTAHFIMSKLAVIHDGSTAKKREKKEKRVHSILK